MPVNRTLKLTIEYDGTDFSGYQVQPGKRTVQRAVEEALERILGSPVRVVAAGRTDAGVHALGQVAALSTDHLIEPARLQAAVNSRLPADVAVA
ncbi:MAG: tRNA pseudouridine(38-40) synthase TruA, partial [Candidatus Latescibacteria bacterium]|nr:tRNA pseudouridine(38-40) synthase TruA [Candidatus Latescibacterota bacterium]